MSASSVQAEAITVGLMIPTKFTDVDEFTRTIEQKIADYGGVAGIEKTYAAGCRRMRIVVFPEGSTPEERIDITLP